MFTCSQVYFCNTKFKWKQMRLHWRSLVRSPAVDPGMTLMIQMEEILTKRETQTAVHVQQPQVQVTLNESISCQPAAQSHMTRSSRGPEASNRHCCISISLSVWWKLNVWSEPEFMRSCYSFRQQKGKDQADIKTAVEQDTCSFGRLEHWLYQQV